MSDNPFPTPDSCSSCEQPSQARGHGSCAEAVFSGMRTGARYGAIIAGGLALLVGSTAIVIAYSFTQQRESIVFAILGVSLGVVVYIICGGIVGAVVTGVVAASRFRRRSRLQTTLRVALALVVVAAVSAAIGFGFYWCSLPGMTTENHVFFFLNLCHQEQYEDAARYLDRHPEIVTDDRAINHGPALLAVALFDGDPRTAQLLLDHGADVNATDEMGATALEVAITNGNLRVAKLLLERVATPGPWSANADANVLIAIIERELAKSVKVKDQKK